MTILSSSTFNDSDLDLSHFTKPSKDGGAPIKDRLSVESYLEVLSKAIAENVSGFHYDRSNFFMGDPMSGESAEKLLEGVKRLEKDYWAKELDVEWKEALNALVHQVCQGVYEGYGYYHEDLAKAIIYEAENNASMTELTPTKVLEAGTEQSFTDDLAFFIAERLQVMEQEAFTPESLVPSREVAEWVYSPGVDTSDEDDLYRHSLSEGETNLPIPKIDVGFEQLIKVTGFSPYVYVDHVLDCARRGQYGEDHAGADFLSELTNEVYAEIENYFVDASKNPDDYNPRVGITEMEEFVFSGLNYPGAPLYFAFVDIKDYVFRDIHMPTKVKNIQVGVHDFFNGSGHLETAKGEITIMPGDLSWSTTSDWRHRVDDVYGFSVSHVTAEVSQDRIWPARLLRPKKGESLIEAVQNLLPEESEQLVHPYEGSDAIVKNKSKLDTKFFLKQQSLAGLKLLNKISQNLEVIEDSKELPELNTLVEQGLIKAYPISSSEDDSSVELHLTEAGCAFVSASREMIKDLEKSRTADNEGSFER